jgi:hypothetical protein
VVHIYESTKNKHSKSQDMKKITLTQTQNVRHLSFTNENKLTVANMMMVRGGTDDGGVIRFKPQ